MAENPTSSARREAPGAADHRGSGGFVHGVDLAVAAVLVAFAGGTYYVTTSFEEVSFLFAQDVPPEFFPRLLIWTIVVLSVLLPFEHLLKPGGRAHFADARSKPIGNMAFKTAALLTLIVLSVSWLSAYLALVLVCLVMPRLWGERRWKLIVPYAVIFPTLVMLVFSKLLGVYFEPGLLGIDFR